MLNAILFHHIQQYHILNQNNVNYDISANNKPITFSSESDVLELNINIGFFSSAVTFSNTTNYILEPLFIYITTFLYIILSLLQM